MEQAPQFIWNCMYLISCCIQLMIPCYFGSLLADKTAQLSFNLYESNWPEMSPQFKSTMRVVLEMTKKPINLCTSWNFIIISLPTFVVVSVIATNQFYLKIFYFFLFPLAGGTICLFAVELLERNKIRRHYACT